MSSDQTISSERLADDIINACTTGQLDQLKLLIPEYHNRAPPTMPTPEYLLQVAAQNGQAEAMRLIFDSLPRYSLRINHPWEPGFPPGVFFAQIPEKWRVYENSIVLCAIEGTNPISVFKLFFDYGMEPDYNLDRAGTPLSCAIGYNKVDLARYLLSHGAKPSGYILQPENTYLYTAARKPTPDMLKVLFNYGATLKDTQALRGAVQNGRLANAQYLLEMGASVNEAYTRFDIEEYKKVLSGYPLHWAIKGEGYEWRRYMEEGECSKAKMVDFLLSHGANPELVDRDGKTPFQLAVESGEEDALTVFREHGVGK